MKLRLTCKETTELVLQGEDRNLSRLERVIVRVHQSYCKGCTRFGQQVKFMRGAMAGWRKYADEGAGEGPKDSVG